MRNHHRLSALLLCAALIVGLLAAGAAAQSGSFGAQTAGDNELPIIPIVPHTHVWDAGTVTTPPSCTAPGVMTYRCTTCSTGVKTEPIAALGHDYVPAVSAPNCTEKGSVTYTCSRCGDSYTEEIEALGHDYVPTVTEPSCTEPGYTTWTCSRCGDGYVADETAALGHTPGEPVEENRAAPSCTEPGGYDTVTCCAVCRAELLRVHTDLPALGHTPGEPVEENRAEPKCTESGGYDTVTYCTVCRAELSRTHTDLAAAGHKWDEGVLTAASGCTSEGVMLYTCTVCGATRTEAAGATGHTPGEPAEENRAEPTCTVAGGYDTVVRCAVCGAILSSEHTELPALEHDYVPAVTAPSCTEPGYTTWTCSRCGDGYAADETAAQGHTPGEPVEENRAEPSCTEPGGYDTVIYCTVCKAELSRAHTAIAALGHTPGEPVEENRAAPSCTEPGGYDTAIYCTVCRAELSRVHTELAAPGHSFENGVCTVCGAEDPDFLPPVGFTDVPDGAYFAVPVAWAVKKQITNGTSATTFSPDDTCTRAQTVTFLWRATGCPEPNGAQNPFDDVTPDAYYYKAVLWAVEKEITNGTDATHFSPEDPCTRGQVVTFLWRSEGKPEAMEAGENELPVQAADTFDDVPADAYYDKAVRWAVAKGVTNGTDPGKFSPDDACTRGQIVTFLYRDMA